MLWAVNQEITMKPLNLHRHACQLPGLFGCLFLVIAASACTPKVEVAVSDKPITINLNVKIEHEIRVKVEKDLENLFENEEGIF
jgi:hypothetical protein